MKLMSIITNQQQRADLNIASTSTQLHYIKLTFKLGPKICANIYLLLERLINVILALQHVYPNPPIAIISFRDIKLTVNGTY